MNIKTKAFTLVEMLFTLVIISILLLLFVPNLNKQKDAVKDTGDAYANLGYFQNLKYVFYAKRLKL